jgi:secretion/DNA translocation related TadE-like protein
VLSIVAMIAFAATAAAMVAVEHAGAVAAADLAALRAADVLQHLGSAGQACAAAARVAAANHAALTECVVSGEIVTVRVVRDGAARVGQHAGATARAGPADG